MTRQWQRIGSAVTILLLLYVAFFGLRYLRGEDEAPVLPVAAQDGQYEQKMPYRPQDEEQQAKPLAPSDPTTPETNTVSASHPEVSQGSQASAEPQSIASAIQDDGENQPPKGWQRPPDMDELLSSFMVETSTTATTGGSIIASPTSTGFSKAIVMGKLKSEDTDWVAQELPDWQRSIYVVNIASNETSPTGLRTSVNKAKEAMPYLTYITDNYPNYPDVMVFLHSHRSGYPQAWHTDARDNDAVNMLHELRLDVVKDRGYVNLRCIEDPGCPEEIIPWRYPPDPEKVPEQIFPWVYAEFFNRTLAQTREEVKLVSTPCCAQFAVSREQILKRPKADYVRYLRYLQETQYSDDHIGRVMEYLWHIMFEQQPVHCPAVGKCWCEIYGRCEPPGRPFRGRPGHPGRPGRPVRPPG